MTAEDFAALLDRAYTTMRPWSAKAVASTLAGPGVLLVNHAQGALLGRVIAGEAEILAFAVDPDAQHAGLGGKILAEFETLARQQGATECFLEVALSNTRADRFYRHKGFAEAGRRPGYYRLRNGMTDDALILKKPLS